jgi:hypothetical protein
MRANEYSILVRIRLSDNELGTRADDELVDGIEAAVAAALDRSPRAGMFDGHEFGGGWATIFCYGRDGRLLAQRVIEPILPFDLPEGSCAILRYGRLSTLEDVFLFAVSSPAN